MFSVMVLYSSSEELCELLVPYAHEQEGNQATSVELDHDGSFISAEENAIPCHQRIYLGHNTSQTIRHDRA